MECNTKELIHYVKHNYVARGQELQGIDFLINSLYKQSPYQDVLIQIRPRILDHTLNSIIIPISNKSGKYSNIKSFVELLNFIGNNEGSYINVRRTHETYNNLYLRDKKGKVINRDIVRGKQKINDPTRIPFPSISANTYRLIGIIVFTILTWYILKAVLANSGLSTRGNIQNSQVDTEKVEASNLGAIELKKLNWGAHYKSYIELESAVKDKEAHSVFHEIKIVQLDDNRFHLIEFANDKKSAQKLLTPSVYRSWPRATYGSYSYCDFYYAENEIGKYIKCYYNAD